MTSTLPETTELPVFTSFDDMSLPMDLLRGIYGNGFERPSAIQSKAIVPMVQGRDILAQAQSGTGKTGTFCIGSLSHVKAEIKKPQVLILVHTHELADQIARVARSISTYMNINVLCAVGGNPLRDDIKMLEDGVHFVVGTPGRVLDLVNRNVLDRSAMQYLILDEADQMLEDLFYKQVISILERGFPASTKVAMFSATMADKVITVADRILNNPVKILIPPRAVRLEGIQQYYVPIAREDHKFECICDLYKNLNLAQTVIFCNKRSKAEYLSEKMIAQGYPVTCVHGELEKGERSRRIKQFFDGHTRVLVATDLLARGIDCQQLSLVINYELSSNTANYVHRIGRAGRFGRKGVTINLILPEEESIMKEISDHYGMVLKELPMDLSTVMA